MKCISQDGVDRGDDRPYALIRRLSIVRAHTRITRALSVRMRILSKIIIIITIINKQSNNHSFIHTVREILS